MLITKVLPFPCPKCGSTGRFGNVHVVKDILIRGCNACGVRMKTHLPHLHKKVLYLDQSFLSLAFKDKDARYVEAVRRIADLTHRQLLVCPRSDIHEHETHLWQADSKAALWNFVKRTARGNEFEQAYYIKDAQLNRSFKAFCDGTPIAHTVDRHDALSRDIDEWESYFYVEVGSYKSDWDAVRSGKKAGVARLVGLFDEWRSSTNTFNQDRILEADGYAGGMIILFDRSMKLLVQGCLMEYFNSSIEGNFVRHLLAAAKDRFGGEEPFSKVREYFSSEYFRQTPYVDIGCQIYALLRARVRMGQFANQEDAVKRLSGFFFDVNALSIFGPYCDGIFVDREMDRWLSDQRLSIGSRYPFKVFSAENFSKFNAFLDDVEVGETEHIKRGVESIAGKQ
ncbi:MAG: hypothetical protein WAS21_15225 [Geminicoccaceae bacterium]